MTVYEQLERLLQQEETRLYDTFTMDRRIAILELTRTIDHFVTGARLGAYNILENGSNDSSTVSLLYSFGWNKALALFYDESVRQIGVPDLPTNETLSQWAQSVLQFCGRIAICENILTRCRSGLMRLRLDGGKTFHAEYSTTPVGLEYFEKQNSHWITASIASQQKDAIKTVEKDWPSVKQEMAKLVSPWHENYIQYGASPSIDRYYETLGILAAQRMHGTDTFPGHALFGGREFTDYRGVLATIIGWTLKHIHFCVALLSGPYNLNARNLQTVWSRVEELADYLELDTDLARQLLEPLIFSPDNSKYHCSIPAGPEPPFIQIADGFILHSVAGCLGNPFVFLASELKRRYRQDYDNAVNLREEVFREELYSLFPETHLVKSKNGFKLKFEGKIITDIDAILFDTKTGSLGLFQLKWQDIFANSERERKSRKQNLYSGAGRWVEKVADWTEQGNMGPLLSSLGLSPLDPSAIKQIYIFVIGRNFAHFSGEEKPEPRAAWGMWPQILRLLTESPNASDPIFDLHSRLNSDSPLIKSLPNIGENLIQFKNWSLIIHPPAGGDDKAVTLI